MHEYAEQSASRTPGSAAGRVSRFESRRAVPYRPTRAGSEASPCGADLRPADGTGQRPSRLPTSGADLPTPHS